MLFLRSNCIYQCLTIVHCLWKQKPLWKKFYLFEVFLYLWFNQFSTTYLTSLPPLPSKLLKQRKGNLQRCQITQLKWQHWQLTWIFNNWTHHSPVTPRNIRRSSDDGISWTDWWSTRSRILISSQWCQRMPFLIQTRKIATRRASRPTFVQGGLRPGDHGRGCHHVQRRLCWHQRQQTTGGWLSI